MGLTEATCIFADFWHQHSDLLFFRREYHLSRPALVAVWTRTCEQRVLADARRPPLTQVFADAGLRSPILGAVLVGVVNIVGTLAATAVTDSFGRKPLMVR